MTARANEGWHRHRRADGVHVVRDDQCPCENAQAYISVLVLDLADPALRERIARAIIDASLDSDGYAGPRKLADAVLAALQEQP